MIEFLKSFLFGIVEGITEWLPISSTGHLILLNQFVKLNVSEEFYSMFEVVIQLGAILAVVILFWNQIFPFGAPEGSHTVRRRQAKHAHRKKKSGNGILSYVKMDIIILWLKVLVACIPAIVIGMPFNDLFEKWFYNYPCVAIALIVFGIAFIIVENNSTEDSTFEYYKEIEAQNPKVHVVYWDKEFNYSAINNYGATFAKGEYILLLNNDTEIINEDCIEELLGYCMRSDVGAVGARMYYEDDTIQHAGVVIGFGGIAGHCFVLQPRGTTGYCHRIICAQDYSAVTAACMMVKRSAFEEVGGLTEELAVAFNDIDFCMKLRTAGYLIVYNPYAELYHYESKSRGLEDTPEKVARFNKEIQIFERRWPDIMRDGDPYYNPNLTLKSQDFSLKRI